MAEMSTLPWAGNINSATKRRTLACWDWEPAEQRLPKLPSVDGVETASLFHGDDDARRGRGKDAEQSANLVKTLSFLLREYKPKAQRVGSQLSLTNQEHKCLSDFSSVSD